MKQEFGKSLPNGLSVDIGVEVDKDTRLAIEAATPADLTSSGGAKGAMVARKRLLEGAGYKVLPVPHAEWAALPGSKEKCAWLLNAVKAAVPAMASRVATLQKKLEEPFDPYAE